MGCQFNFKVLKATSTSEAKDEAEEIIKSAAWEHGHGGYTGSFAEASGVEFSSQPRFSSVKEAEEWLEDHAEKWGPALIVKTTDGKFCLGANCSL